MSARGTELLEEILSLPPQERAQLAERILDSLAPESAHAIQQMCAEEADARLNAYERGEIGALSGEEAIAWLDHRTKRPLAITQHGRGAAVLLDVSECEKLLAKLELLQDVHTAESQIDNGLGISDTAARKKALEK